MMRTEFGPSRTAQPSTRSVPCLTADGRVSEVSGERPKDFPIPGEPKGDAWQNNLNRALGIVQKHGIEVDRQLGCGTYGCAYSLKSHPEHVLKLTGDSIEAASVQVVLAAVRSGQTTWEELPALSRFYCVYAVASTGGSPLGIFITIQDKLNPLPSQARSFINKYRYTILSESMRGNAVRNARNELPPAMVRQVQLLGDTVSALARIGVWWDDLHSGNVMQTSAGDWKIIDLGAGQSQPQVEVAVVEGLPVHYPGVRHGTP